MVLRDGRQKRSPCCRIVREDLMSDRRQFLRSGSLALAAALAGCSRPEQQSSSASSATPSTPGAPPAFNTGPAIGPPVTPETFGEAAKLAQYEMTDAERR